jgi:hypothetical protein
MAPVITTMNHDTHRIGKVCLIAADHNNMLVSHKFTMDGREYIIIV